MSAKLATETMKAIHKLKQEINEFLDKSLMIISPAFEETAGFDTGWTPAMDMLEEEHRYLIFIELPGVKKEDVEVSLEGQTLKITGKRNPPWDNEENVEVIVAERSYQHFERTLHLDTPVDEEHVESLFKSGVLTIILPKRQPRKIPIK